MAFENIIREMDNKRNEEDMKLSFNFEPRSLNEYNRLNEIKERALKKARTTKEYKEVEEAIRMADIEKTLDQDAEFHTMRRNELSAELIPILEKDYQEAIERYKTLSTQYEEKYSAIKVKLMKLLDKATNELLPITEELASIEKASDYLFYSKGPYPYTNRSGIFELIDNDVTPIPKVGKECQKEKNVPLTVRDLTQKTVYPFLEERDSKDALVRKLIEEVEPHE